MTWKSQGPPDGTRRTLKTRTSSIRKLNNTEQNNGSARQIQAPFIGDTATEIIAELRFRRNVERVHALGPRAVGELLSELGSEKAIQTAVDQITARYAAIDPHHLTMLGGDRFARHSLMVVASADEGEK